MVIGAIFIILGLSELSGIDMGRYIGPLFLIGIGWIILNGKKHYRSSHSGATETTDTPELNEVLIFSGTDRKVETADFRGGKIVTVFGGAEIDLSKAKTTKKELKLETVAVFGGIRVKIPANWIVVSEVAAILGGMDNTTKKGKQSNTVLRLTGAAVFGGIEVYS